MTVQSSRARPPGEGTSICGGHMLLIVQSKNFCTEADLAASLGLRPKRTHDWGKCASIEGCSGCRVGTVGRRRVFGAWLCTERNSRRSAITGDGSERHGPDVARHWVRRVR